MVETKTATRKVGKDEEEEEGEWRTRGQAGERESEKAD